MTEIELPPGFRIQTFEPAPADFDPLTAPESLLRRYGYPPRPDAKSAPELHAQWEQRCLLLRGATYIEPIFKIIEGIKQGPRLDSEEGKLWSGCIIPPRTGGRFFGVNGAWTVPSPKPPRPPRPPGIYACIQWVGIDDGPPRPAPLVHAGTEVVGPFRGSPMDSYAWWGWYPYSFVIKNFPVVPGDRIYCDVWPGLDPDIIPWSMASFTLLNMNPSPPIQTSFTVNQPREPLSLVGHRAEWIVGRPTWAALANYGSINMTGGGSLATSRHYYSSAGLYGCGGFDHHGRR